MKRSALREQTAAAINALSRKELLEEFGISRISDLTGLDRIGVPVTSCTRVLSKTIAIHTGKGLTYEAARAGAILEGIELEVAEHPIGSCTVAAAFQIPEEDRLPIADCFPARSSIVNELTPLAWEPVTNIQNGSETLIPSDLIWMVPRLNHQPIMYVQMGSNGLASGGTLEDAILSGLYEVLERDAWTLNEYLLDYYGVMPARVPMVNLSERLETIVRKIEAAGVKLHLFEITNNYSVPVYSAILLDLSGNSAGTFGGYGCHLNAEIAAIRAITEAVQGRASYISGARDDLFRRQFLVMKRMNQQNLDAVFNGLNPGALISEHRVLDFPDVKTELRYLLKLIKGLGVNEVFVKEMGSFLDGAVHVVRVVSPQCEQFRFDHWTPSLRCLSYARSYLEKLSEGKDKTAPAPKEGEAWTL
jgi:ribosomal protein S12 methylthiotransferase accessory factor